MKLTSYTLVFLSALYLTACGGNKSDSISKTLSSDISSSQIPKAPRPALSPLMEGKLIFTRCKACHTLEPGGKALIGPNLYGFWNTPSGSRKGFVYSKAMMNSGIIWTEDIVFDYLENPMKYIPGTRMVFAGLRAERDRENLILYLKSETLAGFDINAERPPELDTPNNAAVNESSPQD